MTNLKELFVSCTHEDRVFALADLMRPYIEDLDSIEYGFLNVDAKEQVADDISELRYRSLKATADLFARFSRSVPHNLWEEQVISILFPYLQDQLEVRLRLLGIYWERMKAHNFKTPNPDLECMGAIIAPLTELIQECADWDVNEEESTTQSDLPEKCLVG